MAYPIYNAPSPEDVDLERKIRMAEMLRQQSDPMEGKMVSGHYVVPSFTQGLANLLRSYSAGRIESDADKAKKDALRKRQEAIGNVIRAGTTPGVQGGFKAGTNQFGNPQDAQAYRAQELERMSMEADLNNPPIQDQPKVQTFGLGIDQVDYQGIGHNGEKVPPAGTMNMLGREQQSNEPVATMPEVGATAPQMDSMPITEIQGRKASFDPKAALFAAMQSGDMQTVNAVLPYLSAYSEMVKKDKPTEIFGKVMPSDFTPESLDRFSKTGNYSDLKRIQSGVFGNVNPGQFTPESLAKYQATGNYADLVPRFAPQKLDTGDTTGLYDPITGKPIAPPLQKKLAPQELPGTIAAQEAAKARAKARVEQDVDVSNKVRKADTLINQIDQAEAILKSGAPSGSTPGALMASGKQFLGKSDATTQANEQLKLIAGWMVSNVPRMEGPQSNFDVQNYREMAAAVGDASKPINDRLAALRGLRALQQKYKESQGGGLSNSAPSGPANASGPFKDPDKERRYQEWKRRQK